MPFTETPTEPKPPPPTEPPPPAAATAPRVLAGRHGVIDTHELIRLLDSLEDERSRGRFRESLYISFFVWIAIAWFIFYGPRMLWHAPELRDPAYRPPRTRTHRACRYPLRRAFRLARPFQNPRTPAIRHCKKRWRISAKPPPGPAPAPSAPPPPPAATTPPPPPPPVTTNAPRVPPPVVADAPTAQPSFSKAPSAGNAIQQALDAAARDRTGGNVGNLGGRPPPPPSPAHKNFGGVEVLSDMQNVDFNPLPPPHRSATSSATGNRSCRPESPVPPLFKQGETIYIRFTILPDGSIKSASMHLDGSTHDVAIDKSCWSAITSEGQFPPLPKNFHGPESRDCASTS